MSRGRRLLPATIVATWSLILLGIYTAAIGAGLTCDARWPLCDGAVFGLFPANWTSFVEWFHRLVAMITGFMILGSWWVVWRNSTRRLARAAMTLAILLLPIQVWLGAETVWQYEVVILIAHFGTALVIYGALIAGTWWWSGARLTAGWRRRLLALSLALLPPFIALTPHFLFVHSGRVQITYYGIGLALFTALGIIGLDGIEQREHRHRRTGGLAILGVLVLSVQLVVGRLVRSQLLHTIDWLAAIALLVIVLLGLWMNGGIRRASGRRSLVR